VAPIPGSAPGQWAALTRSGQIIAFCPGSGDIREIVTLDEVDIPPLGAPVTLVASHQGRWFACASALDRTGVVLNGANGTISMRLDRGDYHIDVSRFALAFFEHDSHDYVVHATAWNRLDISEAATGRLLTPRQYGATPEGKHHPEHYLDYFHGCLLVSPDGGRIADNGWVWSPVGVVSTWSLRQWLNDNVWESEDGSSRRWLCERAYYWDGPFCWIDGTTLAIWGYGSDDDWLLPAVRLFDVVTGEERGWFPGPDISPQKRNPWPRGATGFLAFHRYLFSVSPENGTSVWDVHDGARVLAAPDFRPDAFHPTTGEFLTLLPEGGVRVSHLAE